jgi:hypothetical protein
MAAFLDGVGGNDNVAGGVLVHGQWSGTVSKSVSKGVLESL